MLPKISVKKPLTVFVAVILVLVLGVVSFLGMSTDLLPNMNLPYVVVMTAYPGASPEEVETVVTRPVEQAMGTVSSIKKITSTSQENMSVVLLEFAQTSNMDSIALEIRENLDLIKGYWSDSVGSPTMLKINPEMLPVMIAAVDIDGKSAAEVSRYTDQNIVKDFESIEGLASVSTTGLIEEKVNVILRQDKIDALNKKISDSINDNMDEAAEKLAKAKAQITKGQSKLNKERSNVMGQINKAGTALEKAKEQVADGEAQLKESEGNIKLFEQLISKAIDELDGKKETLQKERAQLEQKKSELSAIENPTDDQKQELAAVILQIGERDAAIAALKYGGGEVEKLNNELSAERKKLDAAKKQIAEGKAELAKQEATYEKGRSEALKGFTTASNKLKSAAGKINTAQKELKDGREQALEQAALDEFLTIDMVKTILAAENFSMPAGYVSEEGTDYLVRIGEEFEDLSDMSNMVLIDLDMRKVLDPIKLSDVADVMIVNNSDEVYGKVNGNDAVLLTFQKQPNFSTEKITKEIRSRADAMTAADSSIRFTVLMDQGIYINIIIKSVLENLLIGAILAILILLIFLRDVRPTLVIAISIPVSVVFAIVLMYFTGVTINIISLSGLALGVGMLVDNSIVVIENIYRLRSEGVPPAKAAVEGAKQVTGAIFSSTLTTVCVFAPIVFVQGISRQLFSDLALTIAYSLMASLFVALTVVPSMSAGILRKVKEKKHDIFKAVTKGYSFTLRKLLKCRILVILIALILFGLSLYSAVSMGLEFIPKMDSTQVSVTLTMPENTKMDEAAKITDTVVEQILKMDDIEAVGAMQSGTGGSMLTGMSGNSSGDTMSIYAILSDDKKKTSQEIALDIEKLSGKYGCELDANGSLMDISMLGGSGVSVIIKGQDIDELTSLSSKVADLVRETDGTKNVFDGIDKPSNEMHVIVDKQKAIAQNLTVAQVYQEISKLLSQPPSATTLTINHIDYPVIVIDEKNQELTMDDIKNTTITITDKDGEEKKIKVSSIADIKEGGGLSVIQRDDQQRYLNVTAEIDEEHNIGLVSRELEKKFSKMDIPEGYSVKIEGENETITDAMNDLYLMFALAVVLIYLIMVAQFQSLLSPFIIMITIPLAITGGLISLFLTNNELSVIAMIGFIMLAGIVVNNGIVLIDRVIQLRREGQDKNTAIIIAGEQRLRPILMTAITTILGLVPMAVGIGMGTDMVQPLAIVSIGGLIYATLLTLYVVPCLYSLLNKNKSLKDALQREEEEELTNRNESENDSQDSQISELSE